MMRLTGKKASPWSAGSTVSSPSVLRTKFSNTSASRRMNSPVAAQAFDHPLMDRAYFRELEDRFRSPHLWRYENGTWALTSAVWHDDF